MINIFSIEHSRWPKQYFDFTEVQYIILICKVCLLCVLKASYICFPYVLWKCPSTEMSLTLVFTLSHRTFLICSIYGKIMSESSTVTYWHTLWHRIHWDNHRYHDGKSRFKRIIYILIQYPWWRWHREGRRIGVEHVSDTINHDHRRFVYIPGRRVNNDSTAMMLLW
jgi:hypothetical protein